MSLVKKLARLKLLGKLGEGLENLNVVTDPYISIGGKPATSLFYKNNLRKNDMPILDRALSNLGIMDSEQIILSGYSKYDYRTFITGSYSNLSFYLRPGSTRRDIHIKGCLSSSFNDFEWFDYISSLYIYSDTVVTDCFNNLSKDLNKTSTTSLFLVFTDCEIIDSFNNININITDINSKVIIDFRGNVKFKNSFHNINCKECVVINPPEGFEIDFGDTVSVLHIYAEGDIVNCFNLFESDKISILIHIKKDINIVSSFCKLSNSSRFLNITKQVSGSIKNYRIPVTLGTFSTKRT